MLLARGRILQCTYGTRGALFPDQQDVTTPIGPSSVAQTEHAAPLFLRDEFFADCGCLNVLVHMITMFMFVTMLYTTDEGPIVVEMSC